MAEGSFVAYCRVSTARQGKSGLGLEAQREAVRNYLDGGQWSLVAEFTEVESGKKDDRPELAKALQACRVYGAKLVIAKLDGASKKKYKMPLMIMSESVLYAVRPRVVLSWTEKDFPNNATRWEFRQG